MKRWIRWALFDTAIGDLVLRALECVTGLCLVDVAEIDGNRWGATALGRDRARVS